MKAENRLLAPWHGGQRYVLIVALLVVWEAAVRVGGVSSLFLPSPVSILTKFYYILFVSQEIWRHLYDSMHRLVLGLALATVVGAFFGVVMGSSERIYRYLDTFVEALRPIPAIALIPFAIFYIGIGDGSKVFLIAYGATFPLLLNTISGMRATEKVLINAGRVLGGSNWQIITRVRLPAALPLMLTGLRISVGIGLVVLVASEMVAANSGLGFYILHKQMTWDIEGMFCGIILLSVIGVTLNWALLKLEAQVLKWR